MNTSVNPLLYFKLLGRDYASVHGFSYADGSSCWEAPTYKEGRWHTGAWKKNAKLGLNPHKEGIHLVAANMVLHWLQPRVCIAVCRGPVVRALDCVVVNEAALKAEVYLPGGLSYALALEMAFLAYDLFEVLITKEDVCRRLKTILSTVEKGETLRAIARTQALEVIPFLEYQKHIGIELNDLVGAAEEFARTVCFLLDKTLHKGVNNNNGVILRQQAAHLMAGIEKMVYAQVMACRSTDFQDIYSGLPRSLWPFLKPHSQYPLIGHAVRYQVGQHFNNKLLKILRMRHSEVPLFGK